MTVTIGHQVWLAALKEIGKALKTDPLQRSQIPVFKDGLKRFTKAKPFIVMLPEILGGEHDLLNEKADLRNIVFGKLRYYNYLNENDYSSMLGEDDVEIEVINGDILKTILALDHMTRNLDIYREEHPDYDKRIYSRIWDLSPELIERLLLGEVIMSELLLLAPSVFTTPLSGGVEAVSFPPQPTTELN